MVIQSMKRVFAVMVILLSSFAVTAFAEDAPVYDVDNYPPQFDGQPDAGSPQAPRAQTMPQAVPPTQEAQAVVQSPPLTTDQRLNRVEQQMTNLEHSDAASRMSALQNEVQTLRGQVEDLTHQLQQMQAQQRSMYSDLDKRINKQPVVATTEKSPLPQPKKTASTKKSKAVLTTASVPAADEPAADDQPVPATKAVAAAPAVSSKPVQSASAEQDELQMYQNAYDLIKDSKFDQAIGVLQNMLKKYPSGQSAANAHYWLGELYGLQKKRDQSAMEFANVVKNYPDSPKVSDAEVKLGMIYTAQLKWADAKATFKRVMARYPGTTSARLAAEQLKEMKTEGK